MLKLRHISTIAISISLVFFMAHFVLPHHHHHDHVCLDVAVSISSCISCESYPVENNRSCGDNSDCRAYDPFLVRIDSDHDIADRCGIDFAPVLFFIDFNLNNVQQRLISNAFRSVDPPYLIRRYLEYAADSLALRAPPFNSECKES